MRSRGLSVAAAGGDAVTHVADLDHSPGRARPVLSAAAQLVSWQVEAAVRLKAASRPAQYASRSAYRTCLHLPAVSGFQALLGIVRARPRFLGSTDSPVCCVTRSHPRGSRRRSALPGTMRPLVIEPPVRPPAASIVKRSQASANFTSLWRSAGIASGRHPGPDIASDPGFKERWLWCSRRDRRVIVAV